MSGNRINAKGKEGWLNKLDRKIGSQIRYDRKEGLQNR